MYGVNVKFVPEVIPESEESEVLRAGREDRAVNGTIPHGAINWEEEIELKKMDLDKIKGN